MRSKQRSAKARPENKFRLSGLLRSGIWGIGICLVCSTVIAHASEPSRFADEPDPIREIGTRASASEPAQTAGSPSSAARPAISTTSDEARIARARARRAARRAARRKALAASSSGAQAAPASAGQTTSQRHRDEQILAEQKARSDETARENNALTQQLIRDQNRQQEEPRIQDAPGPGSEPLAGDPAIAPTRTGDAPRIQDAPGPSQTLPKAPPDADPNAPPAQTAPHP